ncbi:hypothetical protein [Nocardia sp. CC201C]|uniref:hypothetical protein n=1 Tax=Nocardia sp. CC201C TaxID=3044575 RepID=UPI0024A9256F|nr:hypothetical protein [Nocardia sp. CC201C]
MSARELRLQPWQTLLEEWTAQQYGLPLSLLMTMMQRRPRTAYAFAKRLKDAGRAQVSRVGYGSPGPWRRSKHFDTADETPHGPLWLYPTREIAWGYLGFDPGEWHPKPSTAAHLTAVSELRLALTGLETDPEIWTSERLLRRIVKPEAGQPSSHLHDAWCRDFTDPDKVWAIEVELSRKRGEGRLLRSVSAALEAADRHDLAGVLYFVRGESLRRALEGVAAQLAHRRGVDVLANLEIHDLDLTLARKGVR